MNPISDRVNELFTTYPGASGCIMNINEYVDIMADPMVETIRDRKTLQSGLYGRMLGRYLIVSKQVEPGDLHLFVGDNWFPYCDKEWLSGYKNKEWEELVSEMTMNEVLS